MFNFLSSTMTIELTIATNTPDHLPEGLLLNSSTHFHTMLLRPIEGLVCDSVSLDIRNPDAMSANVT
jgi:hypothetical protein